MPNFTLELLHIADQEGNTNAVVDAPNLSAVLNALRAEDIGNDGQPDNTLTLSSGDAFIPGVFYEASEAVFGSVGIADIQIQNELGLQAVALGNHEFDQGTEVLAGLISGTAPGDFSGLTGTDLEGTQFGGADFPYLSTNLDFSTDANLAGLEVTGGQAPQANSVTSSVVQEVNGEQIGIVGATTPTLGSISSPGTVGISPSGFGTPPSQADIDALAAEIQSEVDALTASGIDKVILLSHMQNLDIERALAAELTDVDIIIGGGSDTILADSDDRLRDGDQAADTYPIEVTNAGGTTTLVVNTDGQYRYVGRLVVDFDENGNIVPDSVDESVSGAFATDQQGVVEAAVGLGTVDLLLEESQEVNNVPDGAANGRFTITSIDYETGEVSMFGLFSDLQTDNPSNQLFDVGPAQDAEGNPQSAIHLHDGDAGTNGSIVRNFTVNDNGDGSGSFTGSFDFTDAEFADFLNGGYYINLHTTDFNGGQLRGQVDLDEFVEASALIDPEIQAIVDAIETEIIATEGNVFGVSDVFLNGIREGDPNSPTDPDGVRTQETNLGNLTADANLAAAQAIDSSIVVSLKNGGGIRANIGEVVVPAGGTDAQRLPNEEIRDADGNLVKPAGGISQTDIASALSFNNSLVALTVTAEELVAILEHAIGALPNAEGQFPQVSGVQFTFDDTGLQDLVLVNPETGVILSEVARDGTLQVDPAQEIRLVTLNFLAEPNFDDNGNYIGGGNGYPFPNFNTDPNANGLGTAELGDPATVARVNAVFLEDEGTQTGAATFADDGTEQDALAEYLAANFSDSANAFDEADTGRDEDNRIVNLDFNDAFNVTIQGSAGQDDLTGFGGDDEILSSGGDDTVTGLAGDDVLIGNGGSDLLVGGAGSDSLLGGIADDTLDGGAGDDTLNGGQGADSMAGGAGDDTYIVSRISDVVTELAFGGVDTIQSTVRTELDVAVENAIIVGTRGAGAFGNGRSNTLTGNEASNVLAGRESSDTLIGNGGDDLVFGGNGDDHLEGGEGNDILGGGQGLDLFVFREAGDSNADTIRDFDASGDVIALDATVFDAFANASGPILAGEFVVGTAAQDANDFLIYDDVSGILLYDADGNGAGQAVRVLTNEQLDALGSNNFVLV